MFVFDVWLTLPLLLSALPQTAFVLIFSLRVFGAGEWWRDRVGRALFFKSLTLAAVLDVLLARVLYLMAQAGDVSLKTAPPTAAIEWVFSALYWLIFAGIVYQLGALVSERARG